MRHTGKRASQRLVAPDNQLRYSGTVAVPYFGFGRQKRYYNNTLVPPPDTAKYATHILHGLSTMARTSAFVSGRSS